MRQLEERNAGHAERTRQLEDELRRAGSLRAQLEAQRRQVRRRPGQSLGGPGAPGRWTPHPSHFGPSSGWLSPCPQSPLSLISGSALQSCRLLPGLGSLTALKFSVSGLAGPTPPPSSPASPPVLSVQVQELQGQRQEEAMKAEKWLFECRNLEEKYELVTKEKEVRLKSRI